MPTRPVAAKLRGEGRPEDRRKLADAVGPVVTSRLPAGVSTAVHRPQPAPAKLSEAVSARARQAMLMALDGADFGIAEMEALGLSLRVINLLEEKLGIIWLRELLAYDPQELRQKVPFLGQSGVEEIVGCLGRFDQLLDYQARLAQALKPGAVPAR